MSKIISQSETTASRYDAGASSMEWRPLIAIDANVQMQNPKDEAMFDETTMVDDDEVMAKSKATVQPKPSWFDDDDYIVQILNASSYDAGARSMEWRSMRTSRCRTLMTKPCSTKQPWSMMMKRKVYKRRLETQWLDSNCEKSVTTVKFVVRKLRTTKSQLPILCFGPKGRSCWGTL
ncbi:uncharacterized protein [Malus domestica]|uniref:uncharacterized protein isoform X3 n=1 Tax=Malus domestica TaxID=3750 RepID=UPI003976FB19